MSNEIENQDQESPKETPVINDPDALLNAYNRTKENYQKTKNELVEARKALAELNKKYQEVADINPEEYQALKKNHDDLIQKKQQDERKALEQQERWTDLIKLEVDTKTNQLNAQLTDLSKTNQALVDQLKQMQEAKMQIESQYQRTKIETEIKDVFLRNGGDPDAIRYALYDLSAYVKLGEDGNLVVVDERGSIRQDKKGNLIGLTELVQEYQNKTPRNFLANQSYGSGINPQPTNRQSSGLPAISRKDLHDPNFLGSEAGKAALTIFSTKQLGVDYILTD